MDKKFYNSFGLVNTIDNDEDIEDLDDSGSDENNADDDKIKFAPGFKFTDEELEVGNSAWNDIRKYVTRKVSTLDEKISQFREERRQKRLKQKHESVTNAAITNTSSDEKKQETCDQPHDEEEEAANCMVVSDQEEEVTESMAISDEESDGPEDIVKIKKEPRKNKRKHVDEDKNCIGADLEYDPSMTFQQMNLSRPLQKAIATMNFLHPTPIQTATIPVALMGRDIYGCAATGTGKTAAFMLPVLERLLFKPKYSPITRVLVLLPTRELAVQVYQVTRQLAQFTKIQVALSAGGLDLKVQEVALRRLPDIIISTPGRLIDHLENTPSFNLHNIEILILDEADRILDEHFIEQMKEIIKQCSYTRQTMLFSATLNEDVKDLAASSLKDPVKIFINSNTDVAFNLHQEFLRIRPNKEAEREAILTALLSRTFQDHVLVFVQTKKQAHRLHILLGLLGLKVTELQGDMNQMQRLESLRKFKEEEVDILVATDVASRGLDIPSVKTVINFTLPCTLQHYIHRVGRTARAGRSGRSVSMVSEQERKLLKQIVKEAKTPVKRRTVPQEIINKYQTQLNELEEDLVRVLREEKEEKELKSLEKDVKKAEHIVSGDKQNSQPRRTWFKTPAEIRKEKNALYLEGRKNRKDNKKGGKSTAEDRISVELQKAALYQARLAKKMQRPKRIRAITENDGRSKPKFAQKKAKKSFDKELVNTSRKAVKQFRYEATSFEKTEKRLKSKPNKKFKSKSKFRRKR